MTHHADILDAHEPIRGSFFAAVALHGSIVAALLLSAWLHKPGETLGGNDPAFGAVGVQVLETIPLQHQGAQNPVANESESQVPQSIDMGKPQQKAEKIEKDTVLLRNKKAKPQKIVEQTKVQRHYVPFKDLEKNQLTSTVPPQVSNPIFQPKPGSGLVGTGPNTTLGTRCAGYATQIQSIVARNWRTGDVEARYSSGPPVISQFDLMKDGSIRNVTLLQLSNISSLDASVRRAILDSNPLPPIPPECNKESAKVEFTFELKR